jgi:RNA polymerase sigma-70 factor (ECF subfamily)
METLALMTAADGCDTPGEGSELLKLARAGDLGAFEQLMKQHQRQVLGVALRLLGRLEDAQDAAQEVFVRLYRHIRRLDDSRALRPWLYRTTVNVCRDIYRKRRPEVPLEDVTAPAASWDELASERRRILSESLKILGEKERAALVLREIEGLSTREVAAALGTSEGTVRSHVFTARAKLARFVANWTRRRI